MPNDDNRFSWAKLLGILKDALAILGAICGVLFVVSLVQAPALDHADVRVELYEGDRCVQDAPVRGPVTVSDNGYGYRNADGGKEFRKWSKGRIVLKRVSP